MKPKTIFQKIDDFYDDAVLFRKKCEDLLYRVQDCNSLRWKNITDEELYFFLIETLDTNNNN